MRRTLLFAGIALVLFLALMVMEHFRAEEPFTWGGFLIDLFETALLAAAVGFTALSSIETREMRRERRDLMTDLDLARHESDKWRAAARAHIDGLSRAIRSQFLDWRLTEAEADVAVMMLKGLTHKEIATLRACSEATVRQHATAAYRKSGLSSRTQFTAFFLEDLLAPMTDRVPGGPLPMLDGAHKKVT